MDMTADSMLSGAAYGIARMNEGKEFDFYFRGTLALLKGSLDHLLEEYNQKYGLDIGVGELLNVGTFRNAARAQKNADALKFVDFFETERNALYGIPGVGFILTTHGIRDLEIHRSQQPRNVALNFTVSLSLNARIEARDAQGNLIGATDNTVPPKQIDPTPPEVHFYLQQWNTEDIPTLCERCHAELRSFTKKVKTTFPLT